MPGDAGFSLVELIVAIVILSAGMLGLLGGIAASLKQQAIEKSQVAANHLADSWFEAAEAKTHGADTVQDGGANATFASIVQGPPEITTVVNGVTFTETANFSICTIEAISEPTFTLDDCTGTGTPRPTDTVYGTIHLNWPVADTPHQFTQTRNLADNSIYEPAPTNGTSLSNCTRSGLSTATATLSVINTANSATISTTTSNRASLDTSFHPAKDLGGSAIPSIKVSVSETGLNKATCIPLTWQDTPTGVIGGPLITHQVDLHTDADPQTCTTSQTCVYSAVIPATQLTAPAGHSTGWKSEITFTAQLIDADPDSDPPVTAITRSTTLYLKVPLTLSCAVNTAGLIANRISVVPAVNLLLVKTPPKMLLLATMNCTAAGLGTSAQGYSVGVQYSIQTWQGNNLVTSTVNATLTSADGVNWINLTALIVGAPISQNNQTFTFSTTRAADGSSTSVGVPVTVVL
jgi:prepilin-type N-terminal cleavage/methylation domain-containing protein